jgi:hypothetical protein
MDSELKFYKHPSRDRCFIADAVGGTILIDNYTSLDAAIQARQHLISRLESALRRNAKPIEVDATW